MSRLGSLGAKLYRGEVSYDFIGKRNVWYTVSAVLLLISVGSLLIRGLTLGIEFRGGAEFRVTSPTVNEQAMRDLVSSTVGGEVVVQKVGAETVRAQTEKLTTAQLNEVQTALSKRFNVRVDSIDTQFIGPSWGKDVSTKALRALIFFLLGVIVFLSLYFEWKMAVAAMIALLHDLVITAGLYSLVGFEVTPATVIGFLTILGYSLYDTVVVFDKVRENTHGLQGGSRMTYSQAANLAVNQTLVRSINTSVIALLPIAAILFAGTVLLGAGPLKDLALALFVGVAIGAYSSIFIATPILAQLKEREPAMKALAKRVATRAAGGRTTTRRGAGAQAGETDDEDAGMDSEEQPEPAAAGARSTARPAPARRPNPGAQRNQPRRSGGKSRPGGKKRR
ncbi:MAG: preprotein translocase subunit SecF [Actinomycetota bacterium]|nr:preprotein translocase subunit SecF [Actinomycetota bacterium]